MFEKRLKIFLLILSCVVILLLMRAAQLQVLQAAEWKLEASKTLQHDSPIPTVRGSLMDRNGEILAKEQACVDACVDYPALTPIVDPKWLTETATSRLKQRLGNAWTQLPRVARRKMVDDESVVVQSLINTMWQRLADVSQLSSEKNSAKSEEDIQQIRQNVQRRVELQKKYIWYAAYQRAMKESKPKDTDPKWQRWLSGQAEDVDEIDKYAVTVGEERQAHIILHDINTDVQNELARHPEMYPGLKLMPGLRRVYPYDDVAAQLLGHEGKVLASDLQNDAERESPARRYLPNDDIGRAGLEWLCEPSLRGSLGLTTTRGDDASQNTSTPPIPGQDIRATIDIHLQQDIQRFFGDATIRVNLPNGDTVAVPHQILHGAAVLLDVKSNQVLALVSYPSYDANKFDELYEQMRFDQIDAPLKNRATESQFEPGSTVKPLVGLSAITQGVVKVHEGIECTGYLQLPDSHGKMIRLARSGRCWVASSYAELLHGAVAHHPVPYPHIGRFGNPNGFLIYSDGLERSCNVYFETVADRLGVGSLSSWMRRFGLGSRTGIGIEEGMGRVPGDAPDGFGNKRMTGYMAGIGQGYIAATPIQMANIASTIARGGNLDAAAAYPPGADGKMPRLRNSSEPQTPDRVDLHLDPEALAACREGMFAVVENVTGTGHHAKMDDLKFAGKTGTAQAARFRTLILDPKNNKPLLDADGHKQFKDDYTPGTFEAPSKELPWYRGGGPNGEQIDHAWMIGFAPADNPKVAFAVLVEYGGSGGIAAAEVARTALESCILHGYLNPVSPTTQPVALIETGLMSGPSTRDE